MEANRRSPFGIALRHFREAWGLAREQLAERACLSLRGISDLVSGLRTTPRLETVTMLADGLGLDEGKAPGSWQLQTLLASREFPQRKIDPEDCLCPTSVVGRTEAIETIIEQFAHHRARLGTLVGLGGIGKPRIAIEAGEQLNNLPVSRDMCPG